MMTQLALVSSAALLLAAPGCRREQITPEPEPAPIAAQNAPSSSVLPVPVAASASASASASAQATVPLAPLRAVPLGSTQVAAIWARPRVTSPARSAKEPADVTRFVRADGTVASTRRGIYLVAHDKLYRWESNARTSASERCEPPQQNPFRKRVLRDGAVVPAGGGRRIEVAGFAAPDGNGILPEEETHAPVAILGDTLFVRSDNAGFGCGMHPLYGVEFRAARLLAGGTVKLLRMEDLRDGTGARAGDAMALLNKGTREDDTSLDGPASRDEIETTMALPIFDAAGARWTVQYTTHATWAGSDGGWGGYTRSVKLDLAGLPPPLASLAAFPDVAADYARAHPDEEVRGVSAGEIEAPK
jgi:hypothetical protein